MMIKYKLHWLDGTIEIITGYSISAAFRDAGYGGGANRGLNWWEEIPTIELEELEKQRDGEPNLLKQYSNPIYPIQIRTSDNIDMIIEVHMALPDPPFTILAFGYKAEK